MRSKVATIQDRGGPEEEVASANSSPALLSPFFFHTADQPLFGLYGPPASQGSARRLSFSVPRSATST